MTTRRHESLSDRSELADEFQDQLKHGTQVKHLNLKLQLGKNQLMGHNQTQGKF